MKYIRTKHNIYKVENTYEHLGKTYYGVKQFIATFGEKDVIKQADTIKELCDVFVLSWANQHRIEGTLDFCVYMSKDDRCVPKNSIKIYGAIWTDKGLIYVAKTNDKGELKLL